MFFGDWCDAPFEKLPYGPQIAVLTEEVVDAAGDPGSL